MASTTPPMDLNIDLGELEGEPEALYALATTVNIACGGHAGDDQSMARAVRAALRSNARIAAHPSYPDKEGFGRRARFCDAERLRVSVREQCETLQQLAREAGAVVGAMKPHGALYHDVVDDRTMADALLDATREALPDLAFVVGPAGSALAAAAFERGLSFRREGFADRRYDERGRLVPRSEEGSLILDPQRCAEQAIALARSGAVDTLCVHGDSPGAERIAAAVREALRDHGWLV